MRAIYAGAASLAICMLLAPTSGLAGRSDPMNRYYSATANGHTSTDRERWKAVRKRARAPAKATRAGM